MLDGLASQDGLNEPPDFHVPESSCAPLGPTHSMVSLCFVPFLSSFLTFQVTLLGSYHLLSEFGTLAQGELVDAIPSANANSLHTHIDQVGCCWQKQQFHQIALINIYLVYYDVQKVHVRS